MTPFETRLDLPYTDASHQPGIVIFCTVQNDDTKGLSQQVIAKHFRTGHIFSTLEICIITPIYWSSRLPKITPLKEIADFLV